MIVPVAACHRDRAAVQRAQRRRRQHLRGRSVCGDPAPLEQYHAPDLGDDVGQVVGDEEKARALLCECPHRRAHLVRGAEVETRHRLVEDQRAGPMNEGASDQQAPRLTGRHPGQESIREVGQSEPCQHLVHARLHHWRRLVVWPQADAAEEARQQQVAPGDLPGAGGQQVVGDDADGGAEIPERPAVLSEHGDRGVWSVEWTQLARDDLEHGALARAIRTDDGDVLAGGNDQREVVEDGDAIPDDGDVREDEQGVRHVAYDSRRIPHRDARPGPLRPFRTFALCPFDRCTPARPWSMTRCGPGCHPGVTGARYKADGIIKGRSGVGRRDGQCVRSLGADGEHGMGLRARMRGAGPAVPCRAAGAGRSQRPTPGRHRAIPARAAHAELCSHSPTGLQQRATRQGSVARRAHRAKGRRHLHLAGPGGGRVGVHPQTRPARGTREGGRGQRHWPDPPQRPDRRQLHVLRADVAGRCGPRGYRAQATPGHAGQGRVVDVARGRTAARARRLGETPVVLDQVRAPGPALRARGRHPRAGAYRHGRASAPRRGVPPLDDLSLSADQRSAGTGRRSPDLGDHAR